MRAGARALWVGTRGTGAFRIEGPVRQARTAANELSNGRVSAIAVDSADVWIGTATGLNHVRDGRTLVYDTRHGLPSVDVRALEPAAGGGVWVGTGAGVRLLRGGRLSALSGAQVLDGHDIRALAVARDGALWIGTRTGLFQWNRGVLRRFGRAEGLENGFVSALLIDRDGRLWVGTSGGGLRWLRDGRLVEPALQTPLPSADIRALHQDRAGNVWVATNDAGVALLTETWIVALGPTQGLPGEIALPIMEASDGGVWIGTYGNGLVRLGGNARRTFTMRDGLSSNHVIALAEGTRGVVWVGTREGLNRIAPDGAVRRYTTRDGLSDPAINALYRDPNGVVWVGTNAGVARIDGERLRSFRQLPLGKQSVHVMLRTDDGTLWLGSDAGLLRFDGRAFQRFTTREGLPSDAVYALHEDRDGNLWIGTSAGLALRVEQGFSIIAARQGLPASGVFTILEDDSDRFWLSSNSGLLTVARAELLAVAEGRQAQLTPRRFDDRDGMPSSEANGNFQPAGWRMRDGTLWFPTMKGVAIVDPARLAAARRPPTVVIERVLVDDTVVVRSSDAVVGPGVGHFQVDYAALAFVGGERVEFRYRLRGASDDWANARDGRIAHFGAVEPGQYVFEVQAREPGGEWGSAARTTLELRPWFYQTRTFYAAVVIAVLLLALALHRQRLRSLSVRARELAALATERERAERRYRAIFENAVDIVFTTDLDGVVTSINQKGAAVLGYGVEEIVGRKLADALPPEVAERWQRRLERARTRATTSPEPVQGSLVMKSRELVPVEVAFQLLVEDERPVGLQGIARDLTERRLLEEQVREAQKMEAVGRLAGGVAHDFNNLLTAIRGHTELLLDRPGLAPEARNDLVQIRGAAERAASLTRQLLAFGRKQMMRPRNVELNEVIRDFEKMLSRVLGEDIQLFIDLELGLRPVRVDPGQLEQVLLNLVVNARDSMATGGTLRLRTYSTLVEAPQPRGAERGLARGEYAVLEVADTGCGMDADVQARIFEPFFTTKEQGKGTGLGLSTVYGIVRQSGGQISVTSQPGAGSTFRVYLPQVDEAASAAVSSAASSTAVRGGSEVVLLAEDEPAVRDLTRRILENMGYQVLAAVNGVDALDVASRFGGRIDLLLTDIVMPQMSGTDLARRLAAIRPELRVLYMSGYSDEALAPHVNGAEIALRQKPFAPEVLALRVRQALDASSPARAPS